MHGFFVVKTDDDDKILRIGTQIFQCLEGVACWLSQAVVVFYHWNHTLLIDEHHLALAFDKLGFDDEFVQFLETFPGFDYLPVQPESDCEVVILLG